MFTVANSLTINIRRVFLTIISLLLLSLPGSNKVIYGSHGDTEEITDGVSSFPLAITGISISPEPTVGQIATLSIEVMSSVDEPNAIIDVHLPNEIEIVSGDLEWQGTLTANQRQSHELSFSVLEEGVWRIIVGTASLLSETSRYGDDEFLYIESAVNAAQVIPGAEYRVTQSEYEHIWQSNHEHIPELKADPITTLLPGTPGTITIQGYLTYDAEEADCSPFNQCRISVFNQPLGRVIVELWDREPELNVRLLATTTANSAGFYSVTVPNEDPSDKSSGIDPVLLIYATDGERVQVVNSSEFFYFAVTPDIGVDLPDGVHPFDFHIRKSHTSQAMYIFDKLANVAYEFLESEVAWGNNDKVEVNWPQGCILGFTNDACYLYDRQISLPAETGFQPDIIIHEYGHFVLSRYLGEGTVIQACASVGYEHSLNRPSSTTCAWSEGWANFLEMAVQNDPDYVGYNLETPERLPDPGDEPYIWEAIVSAFLWDIFVREGFNGPANNGNWHLATQVPVLPITLRGFWEQWVETRQIIPADVAAACLKLEELRFFFYPLEVNISPSNSGTVTNNKPAQCLGDAYMQETIIMLIAEAVSGFYFDYWTGDGFGLDNVLTFSMDGPTAITANFNSFLPPGAIVRSIAISSDDAGKGYSYSYLCNESTSYNEIYLGHCNNGSPMVSGFRFQNMTIPAGATITDAYIEFTVDGPYNNAIAVQFHGELSGNSPTFSSGNPPHARAPLTEPVAWNIPASDVWAVWQTRHSPDLSNHVQQIISLSDWSSGDPITIIVQPSSSGNSHRRVIGWDREQSSINTARLHVAYIMGNSPAPTPTFVSTPTPSFTPASTSVWTPTPGFTPSPPPATPSLGLPEQ